MWLQSVLNTLKFGSARTRAGRARCIAPRKMPATCKLLLERLEDRTVPSFLPAVTYPVGLRPFSEAVGDFNNDGKLDLVTANAYSDTVSVLLNIGNGTFQAARNFAVGAGPMAVAVGDFNGDGKLDIVTANNSTISVLLGNGDGTFQAALTFATDSGYSGYNKSLAVGDFNSDGKLDLVVTKYDPYPGSVSVLLGNGDGTFQTARDIRVASEPGTTEIHPTSVAVGDFNHDGRLDLAVASQDITE